MLYVIHMSKNFELPHSSYVMYNNSELLAIVVYTAVIHKS
jgi:hypothetical protein